MRRTLLAWSAALGAAAPLAGQQLAPPTSGGIAALDLALARLVQDRRVLVVAAHPDDEDTELLTLLSRGAGAEAAYLSLTRGEGGQNLIGPELGEGLGLIRTGELLAARSEDGARQYFTRAFDFGFSKTLEEARRFWPADTLLADAVRVIARLRPQVIVSIFTGTPRDGHGQHQMAGVIARRAFAALRDSAWGPARLYQSTRFDTAGTTLILPTGVLDEVAGRSYHQIAMASRSLHRSQDMGQLQRLGSGATRLRLLDEREHGGAAAAAALAPGRAGMLASVDRMFAGIDAGLPRGLERYGALLDSARAILTPRSFDRVLPLLVSALAELRRAGPPAFRAAKEPVLEAAIATAANVIVDATADDDQVVPGQALQVDVAVWSAGAEPARIVAAGVDAPPGWRVAPRGEPAQEGPQQFFAVGRIPLRGFTVRVPDAAPLTTPYLLVRPRIGALYDWSATPEPVRGEPLDPPLVTAWVRLEVAGAAIRLTREVSYRFRDQARGEVRRPIAVVPAVGVRVGPEVLVWSVTADRPRDLTVELTHGARQPTSGELRLELPVGWPEVPPQRFALDEEGAREAFTFQVRAPARLRPGTYEIHAVATAGGARYERDALTLDYPHIRPVTWTTTATVRVEATPLDLPPLRAVGYVRGASDLVPEALRAIGVPLTLLDAGDLERGDLSRFDVIVIGSRAYETDPALVAANGRLLEYARAGGRVIVQYQQYQFVDGHFAPFPLTMGRPHDRVTDEAAAVTVLDPASPAFQTPNAIGPGDWDGWVQDRGLYFARTWDPAYRPLLEMGDGAERLRGGLLVARLGRGLYTYTGLAFFRELPAGVPGAFRLFVNLLGLEPANVP